MSHVPLGKRKGFNEISPPQISPSSSRRGPRARVARRAGTALYVASPTRFVEAAVTVDPVTSEASSVHRGRIHAAAKQLRISEGATAAGQSHSSVTSTAISSDLLESPWGVSPAEQLARFPCVIARTRIRAWAAATNSERTRHVRANDS